jgi:uroporphyrinogen decarboxylase
MTSRQRVLAALNHEEPDRVPVFFGTSGVTSMIEPAYDRLKAHLGITTPTQSFWRAFRYAILDEEVMARVHSDGRPLIPGAPESGHPRDISATEYIDAWGIHWRLSPGSIYYDIATPPLAEATIDDLDSYHWPNLAVASRTAGLAERARAIRESGHAVVLLSGVSPFEYCYMLRGIENWLADMAAEPEFALALLEKVASVMEDGVRALLTEVGDLTDVIITGDDLGSQEAPMISPTMYREMVKPFHKRINATIRSLSDTKIFYHSDGNIISLIDDLIDNGVDLLNPVHVAANEMGDTARLKREFGDRISFCGGIDTARVLPRGTPEEVREEVRRRIRDLAPGGGYILASVHCIQPDVPPENLIAMFDEAMISGRYPISC